MRTYLVPYLVSNVAAVVVLGLAISWPRVARVFLVALFAWAAVTNARFALTTPEVYVEYADLAVSSWYRAFITGWFSRHVEGFVLPIAAGQMVIAVLLTRGRRLRQLGVVGAVVFLLAIAPLGVGAAFPFSLTMSAALVIAHVRLAQVERWAASKTNTRPAPFLRRA